MTEEKSHTQDGTDDAALVEQLKDQLRGQGRKLALDDEDEGSAHDSAPTTSEVTTSEDPTANVEASDGEDAFLLAMAAFRRAKKSGDREATAEAERHLQDVVRSQMSSLECQEEQR